MAYIINKTDGSTLAIVNDFSVDNTSSPLTLIGKGNKDWGENINENFVKLLENFANNTPPLNPLNGQLWYDTSSNTLKIYNSTLASWFSIPINYIDVDFYSQIFTSPSSGRVVGFINNDNIVGLFSDIQVSADKLDNALIFPTVNAQIEFSNGLGPGLNLSNLLSNIYGQSNLNLGIAKSDSLYNVLEIDNNLNSVFRGNLVVSGSSEFKRIKVSSVDTLRPTFFLPSSAGTSGQILVTQGNNNYLKWENPANVLSNDKLVGHENGIDNVYVYASTLSQGIEFYTKNQFRMIIDENGNIGVDTYSPNYKLELNPNVSSNNVSIGLINDNPLLDTSVDIINEFNAGNSANVNFVRRGNLGIMLADIGETIGSINWYSFNDQLYDQNVAKIRSILTTAYPTSTVGGNIEFLSTDSSGILQKRFEINDKGELVVYYNDGSNYYILPSSAGNSGQYLVSNSANNKLKWENIINYEIFVSSYDVSLLPFPNRDIIISGISEYTAYSMFIEKLNLISSPFSGIIITGKLDSATIDPVNHGVRGHGLHSGKVLSLNVSAYTVNNGTLLNTSDIEAGVEYNGKIIIEILENRKIKVTGEIFSVNCSSKFSFIGFNSNTFDHLVIRTPSTFSITGKYNIYEMKNIRSPSYRI